MAFYVTRQIAQPTEFLFGKFENHAALAEKLMDEGYDIQDFEFCQIDEPVTNGYVMRMLSMDFNRWNAPVENGDQLLISVNALINPETNVGLN